MISFIFALWHIHHITGWSHKGRRFKSRRWSRPESLLNWCHFIFKLYLQLIRLEITAMIFFTNFHPQFRYMIASFIVTLSYYASRDDKCCQLAMGKTWILLRHTLSSISHLIIVWDCLRIHTKIYILYKKQILNINSWIRLPCSIKCLRRVILAILPWIRRTKPSHNLLPSV